ncbi:hypothetical protein GIB67_017354, partial [Kingdonia uniflora]
SLAHTLKPHSRGPLFEYIIHNEHSAIITIDYYRQHFIIPSIIVHSSHHNPDNNSLRSSIPSAYKSIHLHSSA